MNDLQVIGSKIMTLPDRPPFMLDRDLAMIYGVGTKQINRAVKRNPGRFPKDFVFQLSKEEAESCCLDSKVPDWHLEDEIFKVTDCDLETDRRGSNIKYLPYGFTREGCNMLSAALTTPTAVARSVQIMRAFSDMERGVGPATAALERLANIVSKMGGNQAITSDRVSALESHVRELIDSGDKRRKFEKQSPRYFDGNLFISAIEGLIASRKAKIIRDICEDGYINQGATIGFVKEMYPRFVYLFPKTTLEILQKHYRLEEYRFLFFSSAVIARQLMADGYIVRPPKNSRFLVRIPGGGRNTTPKSVWKLYADNFNWEI